MAKRLPSGAQSKELTLITAATLPACLVNQAVDDHPQLSAAIPFEYQVIAAQETQAQAAR